MGKGLLESLRKYQPREGKNPLENFITEAFAWILINHSDFSEFLLDDIMAKPNMHLQEMDSKNCKWKTQYNFGGVFPDMVCLSNNNVIVFENKTWSHLHKNQLQNYRNYATNKFANSKVVLITATSHQHAQNPDLALCWHNIYDLISIWLDKNTDAPFIFRDFLKLLKSEGMGPPAPISHESIMYYYTSTNLKKTIGNLIKHVEQENWSLNIKQSYKLSYGEKWGRMGLSLLNSWGPGIFVGILLDGKDHCTKPMNSAKGPDFCLILDFHKEIHKQYPSNPNYIEMVKNLSEKIAKLNNGWQFYNHLDDNTITVKNKWHPIHIRKPMLDVFLGTSTVKEQADIFYQTANELVKIINNEDYFWKLRDDYKNL